MRYLPANVRFGESIITFDHALALSSLIFPTTLRSDYITAELSSASKCFCCRYLFCLESRGLAETMFQSLIVACVVIPLPFRLRSHKKAANESTTVRRKLLQ